MANPIEEVRFLRVKVCGSEYDHDVVILPGCRVERRWAKSLSKRYAGIYQHTPLSREELEEYLSRAGEVDCILVGTGLKGRMRLTPEAEELLRRLAERGVRVVVVESGELPRVELNGCKRLLGVIHVTC